MSIVRQQNAIKNWHEAENYLHSLPSIPNFIYRGQFYMQINALDFDKCEFEGLIIIDNAGFYSEYNSTQKKWYVEWIDTNFISFMKTLTKDGVFAIVKECTSNTIVFELLTDKIL